MLDLLSLITMCAPNIAPATMQAIIKVESGGKPNALGLNKGYKLQSQPKTNEQAKQWADYLERNNYNFDVGLAQINIKNIKKFGYKASDLLDPCLNIKLSAKILSANYKSAKGQSSTSDEALKKAISAYNTGNFSSGFNNGYVKKVYAAASIKNIDLTNITEANPKARPPVIKTIANNHKINPSANQNNEANSSSILLYKRTHYATNAFY